MTLNFGGGLFPQRDVRETPKNAPAASTALGFITISNEADLTADRVLTAGAGISVTDGGANTTATVATDDSAIVHDNLSGFVANEHLDWTGDAGASNIHVNNITAVPEGAVTAHVAAIDHDACLNFVAAEHVVISAGEGIDVAAGVVSGEDSTAANKGIVIVAGTANEITSTYAAGTATLSLTNKTSYWSAPGCAIQNIASVDSTGSGLDESDTEEGYLPVYLPHGAIVTGFRVTGAQNSATVCTLYRKSAAAVGDAMASAEIAAAEDTTISNATIDNSTYAYFVEIVNFDGRIDWVRIKYTTDYI